MKLPVNRYSIDSLTLAREQGSNLSDLLSAHSPVFVKSYGQGSLATVSYRGTGASHTNILWNGVRLNSPMLGQMDISLVPVSFFNKIDLLPGTISSGNVSGGTILMENNPDWNNKYRIGLTQNIASFNTYHTNIMADGSTQKIYARFKGFYVVSQNDFLFINIDKPGDPEEIRQNAGYHNGGFLQEIYYNVTDDILLSAYSWNQWNYRDIPEPTVIEPGEEKQYQDNLFSRNIVQLRRLKDRFILELKTAYIYDDMKYTNERYRNNSRNIVKTLNIQLNGSYYPIEDLEINGHIAESYDEARSTHYDGFKRRNTLNAGIGMEHSLRNRLFTMVTISGFLANKVASPFLPSLSLKYFLFAGKSWNVFGSISRSFKFPDLNDLYWGFDGYARGNPDLDPEHGWNQEVGIGYDNNDSEGLGFAVTGFYTFINDHIYWAPVSEGSVFWKPQNLKKLVSRGIDASIKARFDIHRFLLTVYTGYQYVVSTNEEGEHAHDQSIGKQLIYTPRHQAQFSANAGYGGFSLRTDVQYLGKRYTTADNKRYLPAYWLTDLRVGKDIKLKGHELSFGFRINNLFGTNYRIIARQPMPGRNYQISLTWNTGKTK